jgi:hypothetical protein
MLGSIPGKDKTCLFCVISGYRHEVDENCDLLGYYAVSSGNLMAICTHHYSLRKNPEDRSSHVRVFMSSETSRQALGIIQPHIQWVNRALS